MNEIIQEYALKALAWVESGVDFVTAEVPLYIEELIKWNIIDHSVDLVVILLIATAFLVIALFCKSKCNYYQQLEDTLKAEYDMALEEACQNGARYFDRYRAEHEDTILNYSIGWWILLGCSIITTLLTFLPLRHILKLTLAPKVWLIDYLTTIIN